MSATGRPPEGAGLALYELLRLLPELKTLGPLREALLSASLADEERRWERDRDYATLDARVLGAERIEQTARTVARIEAESLGTLIREVGRALEERAAGRRRQAVEVLLAAASGSMDRERYEEAAALLEVAIRELAELAEPALEGEVARRLGKALWRTGRLDRAVELYTRARELFAGSGDRRREAVAVQGLGNVRAAQGRWGESESDHRRALELSGDEDEPMRGQLYNNLSQVARRQGKLDEAREWQRRAEEIWSRVTAPGDRLVCHNNAGMLHLAEGALEPARAELLAGLALAEADLQRAVILTNLAHVARRSGRTDEAEHLAREAEEYAILAGATDVLVEAYTVLGCVHRDRDSGQCVPLFEKALELSSSGPFRLARARAHLEYGRFRRAIGDHEEAQAHFERSVALYDGTEERLERAEAVAELA